MLCVRACVCLVRWQDNLKASEHTNFGWLKAIFDFFSWTLNLISYSYNVASCFVSSFYLIHVYFSFRRNRNVEHISNTEYEKLIRAKSEENVWKERCTTANACNEICKRAGCSCSDVARLCMHITVDDDGAYEINETRVLAACCYRYCRATRSQPFHDI